MTKINRYKYSMKELVKEFCQGMYDELESNKQFCETYSFDDLYELVYRFFKAVFIKIVTMILGIIACLLASISFHFSFSILFWISFILFLSWIQMDADIKKGMAFIKEVNSYTRS